ncbi:MAG: hypothetical protein ACRYF2_22330, partial [Janthinobacterium lividum]
MPDNAKFQKILALAVNPAAPEGEAQAAFDRLRNLVRLNPHLTTPPSPPPMPPPAPPKPEDITNEWRLTNISSFWLPISIDNLSGHAYGLGLQSKLTCDFSISPTALIVTVSGSMTECQKFGG